MPRPALLFTLCLLAWFPHTVSADDFAITCQPAYGEGVPRTFAWTSAEPPRIMVTYRNFKADEDFLYMFKTKLTVFQGDAVIQENSLTATGKCTPQTRAVHGELWMDKPLPAGEYLLRVTVRDIVSQTEAVFDMPVEVSAVTGFQLFGLRPISAEGHIRPPVYLEGTPMRVQWTLAPSAQGEQVTVRYSLAAAPEKVFDKWQGVLKNEPQTQQTAFTVPGPGKHTLVVHAENHLLAESVTYEIPFVVVGLDELIDNYQF